MKNKELSIALIGMGRADMTPDAGCWEAEDVLTWGTPGPGIPVRVTAEDVSLTKSMVGDTIKVKAGVDIVEELKTLQYRAF